MTVELVVLVVVAAAYGVGRLHQWVRDARNVLGSRRERRKK
jgi:hypothetical protein